MLLPTQRKAVLTIRFLSEIEKEIYLYPVFYREELLPNFRAAFLLPHRFGSYYLQITCNWLHCACACYCSLLL
jgi:hypothetical protein